MIEDTLKSNTYEHLECYFECESCWSRFEAKESVEGLSIKNNEPPHIPTVRECLKCGSDNLMLSKYYNKVEYYHIDNNFEESDFMFSSEDVFIRKQDLQPNDTCIECGDCGAKHNIVKIPALAIRND